MLSFKRVWQSVTEQDRERLRIFYRKEATFDSEIAMESRLGETVVIAESDGEIVGISRALPTTNPQILQPLYYLSVFIGKDSRGGAILNTLLRQSTKILNDYAAANDYPCIGILLELFNKYFYAKPKTWRRKGVWKGSQFHYIGKSIRGYDVRVHYFPDAYLKEPGESHA